MIATNNLILTASQINFQNTTKCYQQGNFFNSLYVIGHLENEVDMNTRGSCSDNCAAFQVAEPLGCYKDMFCAKQSRCQGTNFNLDFFSNNHRLI